MLNALYFNICKVHLEWAKSWLEKCSVELGLQFNVFGVEDYPLPPVRSMKFSGEMLRNSSSFSFWIHYFAICFAEFHLRLMIYL